MKKFLTIITLAIFTACMFTACTASNSSKVTVKAGNGKNVSVSTLMLGSSIEYGSGGKQKLSDYVTRNDVAAFVQDQCDILKNACTNPRTFVPKSVGHLTIDDAIVVDCAGEKLTLYKYHCCVEGVAKNAFGVEGDVQLYVGNDLLDEPRFLIKNNFSRRPFYYIRDYKVKTSGGFVEIPFTYKGKTYYIDTFEKSAKDFCTKMNTN